MTIINLKFYFNPFPSLYFSEFGEDDYENRILISIWNRGSCSDTLIGCFSFKIKHLMRRDNMNVCSWYYLLPSYEIGSRKHYKVKVSSSSSEKRSSRHNANANEEAAKPTTINKDIIGLDKLKMLIERSEIGDFGFTVTGSCPCIVGKVDPEKQAFQQGLRPGDYIVKIHDKNVSRATCESVVKLIKSCKSKLIIEVHRERSSKNTNVEPTAQYVNQFYFNTNNNQNQHQIIQSKSIGTLYTDTTASSEYSGRSIELPQHYNLQTSHTATTATTDSCSRRDYEEEDDEDEVEDDGEEHDEDIYADLVQNNIEIPYVDESEDCEESEKENQDLKVSSPTYYRNVVISTTRNVDCLLVKNEARTRAPLTLASTQQAVTSMQQSDTQYSMITSTNNDLIIHNKYSNFI